MTDERRCTQNTVGGYRCPHTGYVKIAGGWRCYVHSRDHQQAPARRTPTKQMELSDLEARVTAIKTRNAERQKSRYDYALSLGFDSYEASSMMHLKETTIDRLAAERAAQQGEVGK